VRQLGNVHDHKGLPSFASCRGSRSRFASDREISAALGVLEAWEANKTSVGFRNASMLLRTASNEQH
jgi:hypothetical protein